MENEFLTDSELVATVADIKAVAKGLKGEPGQSGDTFPTAWVRTNNFFKVGDGTTAVLGLKHGNGDEFYFEMTPLNLTLWGKVGSTYSGLMQVNTSGVITKIGGGSFAAFSDQRMKKEINSFNDGLSKVLEIEPKSYKYNAVEGTPGADFSEDITNVKRFGVIAQDLQNVCPEMVTADENGFLTVDLSNLPLLLINAVKELNTKIGSLEARILALETPQA